MTRISVTPIIFAKALSDETRQKIMSLCCCKWLSVGEVVSALNVTQPTVSHHLSILKEAGLVDSRREGKQVFYSLNQKKIANACCQLAGDFAPELDVILTPK